MSLGHPRTLLRPSWRRDVKPPLVALGTYCGNYVIDVYSILSHFKTLSLKIHILSVKYIAGIGAFKLEKNL